MDDIAVSKRLDLHQLLVDLISPNKVYFQPPSSIKLIYPCIIYKLDNVSITYADSIKYKNKKRYSVTVIDSNPDSEIPNTILGLDYCTFNRYFVSENLHHYVYILYY